MKHSSHHRVAAVSVDWSDPDLASLLRRSESWQLDKRGDYAPQHVEIFIGWSSAAGRRATLVWERQSCAVVATDFPIGQGEHVRVERRVGSNSRTFFGVVIEGRPGSRAGDAERGIQLYWLRVNSSGS